VNLHVIGDEESRRRDPIDEVILHVIGDEESRRRDEETDGVFALHD
jgi:hypothetical protein